METQPLVYILVSSYSEMAVSGSIGGMTNEGSTRADLKHSHRPMSYHGLLWITLCGMSATISIASAPLNRWIQ